MPILFGGALVMMMLTWRTGTGILAEKTRRMEVSLRDLVTRLDTKPPHRVPGTAIFLTGDPEGAPTALLHNLKHNKIIHERNIILTIRTERHAARLVGRRVRRSSELSPTLPARHHELRLHGDAEHPERHRRLPHARGSPSTSCPPRSSCRGGA